MMKKKVLCGIGIPVGTVLAIVLFFFGAGSYTVHNRKAAPRQVYDSAETFESDLNGGYNLEGTTVSFEAGKVDHNSRLGYNISAGEHLNFYPSDDTEVTEGNIVTVDVKKIKRLTGGHYLIDCYIVSVKSVRAGNSQIASEKDNQRRPTVGPNQIVAYVTVPPTYTPTPTVTFGPTTTPFPTNTPVPNNQRLVGKEDTPEEPSPTPTAKPTPTPKPTATPVPPRTPTPLPTNTPTPMPQAERGMYYTTNELEQAKKGSSGVYSYVYSYSSKGKTYVRYIVIDFDENYAYFFTDGYMEATYDRGEILYGNLNDGVLVSFYSNEEIWSYELCFASKYQPENLYLYDSHESKYECTATILENALSIMQDRRMEDLVNPSSFGWTGDKTVPKLPETRPKYTSIIAPPPTPTPAPVQVTGILLYVEESEKTIGEIVSIRADVFPHDAANQKLVWKSSDETIARVDQYGQLQIINSGTVTVTVTATNGVSESVTLRVGDYIDIPMSVTVTQKRLDSFDIGEDWTYITKVNDEVAEGEHFISAGEEILLYAEFTENDEWPDNGKPDIGEAELSYLVKDEDILNGFEVSFHVYVTEDAGKNARKTAHFLVTYSFDAVTVPDRAIPTPTPTPTPEPTAEPTPTNTPTPTPIVVSDIQLSVDKSEIEVGDVVTIKAKISPQEAVNNGLVWKSSDTNVATITQDGKLTALKKGTVTIVATAPNRVYGTITLKIESYTNVRMRVVATQSRDDDASIGKEWTYTKTVNGEYAGGERLVSAGDVLTLYAKCVEDDTWPDVGEASRKYTVSKNDVLNGFKVSMDVYVTENGGPNKGQTAHFVVTFTFTVIEDK